MGSLDYTPCEARGCDEMATDTCPECVTFFCSECMQDHLAESDCMEKMQNEDWDD